MNAGFGVREVSEGFAVLRWSGENCWCARGAVSPLGEDE